MKKLRALLVGEDTSLIYALPYLLHRAGFVTDVITLNENLKNNKFISEYEIVEDVKSLQQKLVQKNPDLYDFIIICDDITLRNIADSEINISQKLKLLPVCRQQDFQHLYSKIGLSKILSEAQINTPPFAVAGNKIEALEAAQKLQFPVMIKVDSSGGGAGVFECKNESDINLIEDRFLKLPFLVQKKITGLELDLSALYKNGQLINFSYSEIEKVIKKFGPSSLRTYKQLGYLDEEIFLEMQKLGRVLGADGFMNISALKSQDDAKIYLIEADMRPNTWVDHTKFIGDDLAVKIEKYFSQGEVLQYPFSINKKYSETILIPYFLRMSLLEIFCNRYKVWKFMTRQDVEVLGEEVWRRIRMMLRAIKRLPTTIIRLAFPVKEDRLRVRVLFQRFRLSALVILGTQCRGSRDS